MYYVNIFIDRQLHSIPFQPEGNMILRIAALCFIVCAGTVLSGDSPLAQTGRIVDLSHTYTPGEEARRFELETFTADGVDPKEQEEKGYWYIMNFVNVHTHNGTHIELPYHVRKDGMDTAAFPLERLCGDGVVLDLRHIGAGNTISAAQMKQAAQKAGGIRKGDIVLCNLGYAKYYRTDKYGDAPQFSTESVQFLADAGMKMMGVDAVGIEIDGGEHNVNHHVILDKDIALIENVANLDNLTKSRFQVYAFPIAAKGLDSFPIRLVAIE
jgi:arylformamidase